MNYFDYNATTPVHPDVLEAYNVTTKKYFANTASLHSLGQASQYLYETKSQEMLQLVQMPNHQVIYTYNATEANNLAIFGVVGKHQSGKIITTKFEHVSVYKTIQQLEKTFDVVYLDIDENGMVDLEQFQKEMDKSVILVSVMWVNNVIGTIQNIKDIISLMKPYPKAKLHVDGVQGIGKVDYDFNPNDIDLFAISAHKMYGPKGIAALFIKRNVVLQPYLFGSSGQYGVKPGTLDVASIVAFVEAVKISLATKTKNRDYVEELWNYLYHQLEKNEYIQFNTPKDNINYYVLNIALKHAEGETIVHALAKKDIYVSTGSACSSKIKTPERTIYAMTHDEARSYASIRISLSHLTTKNQIDALIAGINEVMPLCMK